MMKRSRLILVTSILSSALCISSAKSNDFEPYLYPTLNDDIHRGPDGIQNVRPLNIAHRGASGLFPEHTAKAYREAIKMGADFIECDVVITKDDVLLCMHDSWLNKTTNVADHPDLFSSDRLATYTIDGESVTSWFTMDYTWSELQVLRRVQDDPGRYRGWDGMFPICTFEEHIQIAKSADRVVGIIPELKNVPELDHIRKQRGYTKKMEDLVLEVLQKYNLDKKDSPCYVQSFDIVGLRRFSRKTEVRLIYLLWDRYNLEELECLHSDFVYGFGAPWKAMLTMENGVATGINKTLLPELARYPLTLYTFKNDEPNSVKFLRDTGNDVYFLYDMFTKFNVTGFFTDYPASLTNYLRLSKP